MYQSTKMIDRLKDYALALSFILILSGCGTDEFRFKVHPTEGVVMKDGKPVANAMIVFHPVDQKTIEIPQGQKGIEIGKPTATTDKDGHFQLSTYLGNDGAPAGDYKVTVILPGDKFSQKTGQVVTEGDEEKAPHSSTLANEISVKAKAANKYAVLQTTTLQATIKPTGENKITFELQ